MLWRWIGNYILIYTGNSNIRNWYVQLLYNNIIYDEFRLQINISMKFDIIKNSSPKYDKKCKNGEIILIYYLNDKKIWGYF